MPPILVPGLRKLFGSLVGNKFFQKAIVPPAQAGGDPRVSATFGSHRQGPLDANQWNVMSRAKKTSKSRTSVVDNSKHWTNSFQILAQADGQKFDDCEIRKSNEILQQLLDEEMEPTL
jgi:hypothetical protein